MVYLSFGLNPTWGVGGGFLLGVISIGTTNLRANPYKSVRFYERNHHLEFKYISNIFQVLYITQL